MKLHKQINYVTIFILSLAIGLSGCGRGGGSSEIRTGLPIPTPVNDKLLLIANNGTTGFELFSTDGTAIGTSLVKDINPNSDSSPSDITAVGGVIYFLASDAAHGRELWKTNGTSATLVKDITPGPTGTVFTNLTAVGTTLFFTADNGVNGAELWKSDGTDSGTVLVKDIYPGLSSSGTPFSSNAYGFVALGNILFFGANDGVNGYELWKSDGTALGTVLVKDINPGLNSSGIYSLTVLGNAVYFAANAGINGYELWKSDGTDSNTVMVKATTPTGVSQWNIPQNITIVGNKLYYTAQDAIGYYSLWKSDGTTLGTSAVGVDVGGGATLFTDVGGVLYFSNGELWKSDGTALGTVMVKDIYPGTYATGTVNEGPNVSLPNKLTAVGNILYFTANDGINGIELWKSDGTALGTVMVKDIYSGTNSTPGSSDPAYLTAIGNTLYFTANDGTNGSELWKTDANAGAVRVSDINPGFGSSAPNPGNGSGPTPAHFTLVGNTMYFSATNGTAGRELWRSDGSATNTMMVQDIGDVGNGSNLSQKFVKLNGISYFVADEGNGNGGELWRTNGTPTGTYMVKQINPVGLGNINNLTVVSNILYFTANDGINGNELWKSDGTEVGTVIVRDIATGSISSDPSSLTAVGDTLYFRANDGLTGFELWRTDVTFGAVQVKDINFGALNGYPDSFTVVNNKLFFSANDGINGIELWTSDGTALGTMIIKDIYPGGSSSSPSNLTAVGNILYFSANDGVNGVELWKSDGTALGTLIVKDVYLGGSSSSPSNLTPVGNILYFGANNGINGVELWESDVLTGATTLVKDIYTGTTTVTIPSKDPTLPPVTTTVPSSSSPRLLTAVGNTLYFNANDGVNGNELWKSDGTVIGTMLVKDINSGLSSSNPACLTVYNGKLYFAANNGVNGNELWMSDGTAIGTELIIDLNSGIGTGLSCIVK